MADTDSSNAPIQQSQTTQDQVTDKIQALMIYEELASDQDATEADQAKVIETLIAMDDAVQKHRIGLQLFSP